jgi:2-dehydropantoate 2-reductase
MFGRESKIAVVGAGAIGGVTAGLLSREGFDVEVVCKSPELARKITDSGLSISGVRGNHTIRIPSVAKLSNLKEKKDIFFLATKATDVVDAAHEIIPLLTDTSVVVSMQNGMCLPMLANILGQNRTISCIIGWGSTVHKSGEFEITADGDFVIGTLDNRQDEQLSSLRDSLATIFPTRTSTNIMGDIYAKLLINSCIATLGAICGLKLGKMLSIKKIRDIAIEIMQEGMAVANAMDCKVEVFVNKLNYYKFLNGTGPYHNLRRHIIIRTIGIKYRKEKSSSLHSLEQGKPSEVEFLNGYIVSAGKEYGVATPVNAKVVEMVREIETGKRQISLSNFDDPFFKEY